MSISLNKNYQTMAGTDQGKTIDNSHNTAMTEIEADMTTIETAVNTNTTDISNNSSDIATNTAAIALNTTHRTSDGKDHSDVVLANTHRANTSNPHSTSDANLVTTDVTTNNASASKHGFLPKLSNISTQYLGGDGSWSTPSAAISYLSRAYLDLPSQNIAQLTPTKVLFNTESYDVGSSFDLVNNRFVAQSNGYYLVTSSAAFIGSTNYDYYLSVYKNGSSLSYSAVNSGGASAIITAGIFDIFYLLANDYIEMYVTSLTGSTVLSAGESLTFISVAKLA